jgi:hypothetical protein
MRLAGFLLALFVGAFLGGTFVTVIIDAVWPLGEPRFGTIAWVRMAPARHRFWTAPLVRLSLAIWRPIEAALRVAFWVTLILFSTYRRTKLAFLMVSGLTYMSAQSIGLPWHISLTLSLLIGTPLAAMFLWEGYEVLKERPWARPAAPVPPAPAQDDAPARPR